MLSNIFGKDMDEILALRNRMGRSGWEQAMDILNVPRVTLASSDLSGTFRQGGLLLSRFPQDTKAMLELEMKSMVSSKNWRIIDEALRAHPDFSTLTEGMGIRLSLEPGLPVRLAQKEEFFQSNLLYRLPGVKQTLGQVVKASERSYTMLNYLRMEAGERFLNICRAAGDTSPETLKAFGELVNAASGWGNLPKALQSSSPLLNAFFFAPRLLWSRFEIPLKILNPKTPALVRQEAIRMFAQFMTAGTYLLAMASNAGAKIEIDPRSSDFGKIRYGNTRIDIWTGYAQWARFLGQLATAQRMTEGKKRKTTRLDVVWNMLQSKEAPLASIITDLLKGQTYTGEELFTGGWGTLRREAFQRLSPLFIQDLIQAIDQDGIGIGMLGGASSLMGFGVTSYTRGRQPQSVLPRTQQAGSK